MKVLDSIENENKIQKIVPERTIKKYKLLDDLSTIESTIKKDFISPESPLEIAVKTTQSAKSFKNIAITMCTNQSYKELAIGFLFTEGIIRSMQDVISIEVLDARVEIVLNKNLESSLDKINRHFFTSSSCGICSKSNIDSINPDSIYLPWTSTFKIGAKELFNLRRFFKTNQDIFDKTGGIHSTILLDSSMKELAVYEDIGRHNSMDKLIGNAFLKNNLPLNKNIMLVSGRISFELVQKSIMAGIPIICGLGAPSDLAIIEAEAQNVTLIGFAKKQSFNVYSAFNRILETNE